MIVWTIAHHLTLEFCYRSAKSTLYLALDLLSIPRLDHIVNSVQHLNLESTHYLDGLSP